MNGRMSEWDPAERDARRAPVPFPRWGSATTFSPAAGQEKKGGDEEEEGKMDSAARLLLREDAAEARVEPCGEEFSSAGTSNN